VLTGAGGNEVLSITERPDPVPRAFEVLVTARYAGLNPADVMQRDGHYPPPPGSPADVPGLEVAGTVSAVGEGVTAVRAGQRVFGIVGGGGLADRVIVHERCLAPVPDGLSEVAAAAVPEAYLTAHDAIRSQAGLVVGETLLVHGATGVVGTAAIQIGLAAGARVFGVVRRPAGRDHVTSLGAEPIDDDDFVDQVMSATQRRGADVVLELVGSGHFPGNLLAGAGGARIVVVGVGAGTEASLPLLMLMRKRQSVRGTALRSRTLEEKAVVTRQFEREVLPALASGAIRPVVSDIFPAAEVAAAFDRLGEPGRIGKVLLDFAS